MVSPKEIPPVPPKEITPSTPPVTLRVTSPKGEKCDEAFKAFSAAYPKRKGNDPTQPAREKFERAIRDGASSETLILGARGYAEEQSKLGKVGTEFIKQRKAWLNEKGWLDYQPKTNGHAVPMVWLTEDDPRWQTAADVWREKRGKPPPILAGSHGNVGRGWHFPPEMIAPTKQA